MKFVTPKSWYLIGKSRDFKFDEIKKISIHQKEFVLTRLSTGVITAWASRCPHMNSDLSRGKILEDELVCPFHAWKFNFKGECTDIPADPRELTCKRNLKTYPVIEKFGLVFLNNSRKPLFKLPIFDDFKDKMVIASQPFKVYQDAPWFIVTANAFDLPHFIHVHNRIPIKQPIIKDQGENAKYIKIEYKIKRSKVLSDRLLSLIFGDDGSLEFTVYQSNYILAKTQIGKFQNHMLISLCPASNNKSISTISVLKDVTNQNILRKMFTHIQLYFQSYFTKKFFEVEAKEVLGIKVSKESLHSTDKVLSSYLEWVEKVLSMQGNRL